MATDPRQKWPLHIAAQETPDPNSVCVVGCALSTQPSSADVKSMRLPKVGGTLTVSGTFNAMQLVGDERKLVFEIVDLMTAFEDKT